MDTFEAAKYKGKDLKLLSRIRMHLHLNTVSDVSIADGRHIEPNILAGHPLDHNTPMTGLAQSLQCLRVEVASVVDAQRILLFFS